MQSKTRSALIGTVLGLTGSALITAAPAHGSCAGAELSVSGKIVNNAQPNTSVFGTLGVVAMKGDFGKMKCGIVGIVNEYRQPPQLPNFHHTISCDDKVVLETGQVLHSQLTFDTNGNFTDPFVHPLPFVETSTPIAGTGRGVFTDAKSGELTITGVLDTVTGTIDMEFDGTICIDPS